ncbi:MAG: hypothetical protein PHU51_02950 [Candidatus Nanoarchaeia archaeon]|nr:hypothetical protein [Candidatus Nanoarchaeia archaeon]
MSAFETFKKIGFVLLIVLVFTPLTFLITNTIVDNYIVTEKTEDCYLMYKPYDQQSQFEESVAQKQEMTLCEESNRLIIEEQETYKFTIIAILNVLVILILFLLSTKLDEVIYYSLFFGAGINTVSIVMRYGRMNSLTGAIFGIVLFVLIVTFINKALKKDKKKKN